mmetsp:Transcript_64630/g.74239  ORF Transcript_64630/g.74239 Transcript_64630/m.74239 type:complete len:84 (-) Transcript_64630:134-385(-)
MLNDYKLSARGNFWIFFFSSTLMQSNSPRSKKLSESKIPFLGKRKRVSWFSQNFFQRQLQFISPALKKSLHSCQLSGKTYSSC